jgi:hypothetical protein
MWGGSEGRARAIIRSIDPRNAPIGKTLVLALVILVHHRRVRAREEDLWRSLVD